MLEPLFSSLVEATATVNDLVAVLAGGGELLQGDDAAQTQGNDAFAGSTFRTAGAPGLDVGEGDLLEARLGALE